MKNIVYALFAKEKPTSGDLKQGTTLFVYDYDKKEILNYACITNEDQIYPVQRWFNGFCCGVSAATGESPNILKMFFAEGRWSEYLRCIAVLEKELYE